MDSTIKMFGQAQGADGKLELLKRITLESSTISQIAIGKGLQMFAYIEKARPESKVKFVSNEGKVLK